MKLSRILALALSLAVSVTLLGGCQKSETPSASSSAAADSSVSTPDGSAPDVSRPAGDVGANVTFLSGPTGVGAAKMMEDNAASDSPAWNISIAATNDEIVPMLNQGSLDIAATATNVASNLYNKTDGKITMLAINTEGVLYVLEKGNSIQSMADLKGKTLYAPITAKGANPEFIFNYLLTANGVQPAEVTIEWLTPQEITAKLASSDSGIALLPVPAATALLLKDQDMREALNLSAEWNKVSKSPLVMGCVVVRTQFLQENPDVVDAFLKEYQASIAYMKDPANLEAGAALVAKHGITANAQIAKRAIPQCNLTYLEGADMRQAAQDYYEILFKANPASIGGSIPYDSFYYIP